MNLSRFVSTLARCGADLSRWPPNEQAAAQTLLQRSTQARAEWQAFRDLDRALTPPPPVTITHRHAEALIFATLHKLDLEPESPAVPIGLRAHAPWSATWFSDQVRQPILAVMMAGMMALGAITGASTVILRPVAAAPVATAWFNAAAPTLSGLLYK
jgi:hypothetical protein